MAKLVIIFCQNFIHLVMLDSPLIRSCPNSVVEMVACGLPVSTRVSGAAEIINHKDLTEDIQLDFIELQTISKLPILNVDKWCEVIECVLDKKNFYADYMLSRFKEDLDIKITSNKYAKFITKYTMPAISVVMSVFNGKNTKRAIDSILSQTFVDFELI